MKKVFLYSIFSLVLLIGLSATRYADSATMNDYCITPPFVVGGVKPNLLMIIDNSSSMGDLQYVDQGKFAGTCTKGSACSDTVSCPSGQTCNNKTFTRNPYYCYDETYNNNNTYVGYFQNKACSSSGKGCIADPDCSGGETCVGPLYYQYDSANAVFNRVANLPSCAAGTSKSIPGNLVICLNGTTVNTFAASGNYLNWLAASKFDAEKQVLTGGKYVSKICSVTPDAGCVVDDDCPVSGETCITDPRNISFLEGESRGCVGRRYIKEALTSNFVNYSSPETNNTNTSLGITFGVRGPISSTNATALSPGGQTYIDVFLGDYIQGNCQTAIDLLQDPNAQKQDIINAIDACLNNAATNKKTCQFDQTTTCNGDPDCIIASGTCNVQNNGVCSVSTAGTCAVTTLGVCSANNGVCQKKICVGGGRAGASCRNGHNEDCNFSSCTTGNVGAMCTANSDCNVKSCTAGKVGSSCAVNADCDAKQCTAPAGKAGKACTVSTDCNDNACAAGSSANAGLFCTSSWDCSSTKGHCLAPSTSQIKSTFTQSMHECYQYLFKGQALGQDAVNLVNNPQGCNQTYSQYKTCTGGAHDGSVCNGDADCGGGLCKNGPDSIQPGSPVLLCSTAYAGYCAANPDNNNWQTTSWLPREYASADACITAKFRQFCNATQFPPVTDPTDSPSQTDQYANLPAIISDMGLEGQLNDPIATLKVQNKMDTAPTGLLQEFTDLIRFGAMSFNTNGSPTECGVCTNDASRPCGNDTGCISPGTCTVQTGIPCPKSCSASKTIACSSTQDCPSGESCDIATPNVTNRDGGTMLQDAYIGDPGVCNADNTKHCTKDLDCGTSDKCITVGNHTFGLIKAVDSIRAATWTPFGEAFYNAIGYLARDPKGPVYPNVGVSRTDLRLNTDDFKENKNPSQYECQGNNILLVTDGMSTTDQNTTVNTMASAYNGSTPAPPITGKINCPAAGLCSPYAGSTDIEQLAWIANNRNIKTLSNSSASADLPSKKSEFITTYVVFESASNGQSGDCNSETLMSNTATYGGTALRRAENPSALKDQLRQSFLQIAARASSGTAASVLASGEGSGANLIQALFYPSRTFGNTQISWLGSLQNFWYYLDPRLASSTIREESNEAAPTYNLNLTDDFIINFEFDFANSVTVAKLYKDTNGTGVQGPYQETKCLDETLSGTLPASVCSSNRIGYLWEAGKTLYHRTGARTIYYSKTGTPGALPKLSDGVDTVLQGLLNAADIEEAKSIADYISGKDVSVCSITHKDCTPPATCGAGDGTCTAYRNRTVNFDNDTGKTWKLGDIVNSTPKISSSAPLNLYHKTYNDKTYEKFIATSDYKNRGMVFVGANDGMLHAFKLGKLALINDNTANKATLAVPSDGGDLADESWAFIPMNALPYLKYLGDPNYSHLYYVDATPYIFDASIGSDHAANPNARRPDDVTKTTWRTVLIGAMRFGGATKDACTTDMNGDGVIDGKDCVVTPKAGSGFSSYFALDITDMTNPQLMWEFSDPGLGFSTSGPAVVRINGSDPVTGKPDPNTNGNWYVVFASGPTGPIDTTTHQFKGYSDQEMKLYVLDLKTGNVLRPISTGLKNAFGGSLINAPIDFDQNDPSKPGFYSDDALYFGYTQAEATPITSFTKWTKGGVLRLTTNESDAVGSWSLSTLIDDTVDPFIGPVTSAVSKLQNYDTNEVRVYFGTGRYYYKMADVVDDAGDSGIRRRLYGVLEPCYKQSVLTGNVHFDTTCGDTASSLGDVTLDSTNKGSGGWFINLDLCTDLSGTEVDCNDITKVKLKAERVVTDPLATPIGVVFFTTTKPTADVCEFGGRTHFWAVQYDSGGAVRKGILRGKALIQVSTGSIEQKDLSTAFMPSSGGGKVDQGAAPGETVEGRRTDMIPGVPPSGSPPGILIPPRPMNKMIHVKER